MIKCNKGEVSLIGSDSVIGAEFCCVALSILKSNILSKGLLDKLMEEAKNICDETNEEDKKVFEAKIDLRELKKQMEENDERNGKNQNI